MCTTIYWITLENLETGEILSLIDRHEWQAGVEIQIPLEEDRQFHSYLVTDVCEDVWEDYPWD